MNANLLTRDIYVYNNDKLNEKGYFLLELKEKREAIDEVLRAYLIKTIVMLKPIGHELDELDTIGLMRYLKECLDEENVDKVMSSIIFYIIGLIQEIQKFEPDWRLSEEEDMIENPFLTIRGNKLYSVETHKKTDMIKTFELVYGFLQDKMDLIDFEHQGDMNDIHRLTLNGELK